jgi:hypothetical protein
VFDDLIFVKQTYFGMHPFCIAEAFAVHQFTFLPFSTEVFWVEIQFVSPLGREKKEEEYFGMYSSCFGPGPKIPATSGVEALVRISSSAFAGIS